MSPKRNKAEKISEPSFNVFADLGFAEPDKHLAKVQLAHQINQIIDALGLDQKEAAALLHIKQPHVSSLSRGILDGFSMERLIGFLNRLNQDVKIVVKPHRPKKDNLGTLTVVID